MISLLLLLLLFFIDIRVTEQSNLIFLKMKTYKKFILNENITSIHDLLIDAYLFSNIKIGEPEFSLKTNITFNSPYFAMLCDCEEKEQEKKYDIYKSSTFKNISTLNRTYAKSRKDIHAVEKMKFNLYDIKEKKVKDLTINLDFVLGVQENKSDNYFEKYYFSLGLRMLVPQDYLKEQKLNIIHDLKYIGIIDNYDWFFYFEPKEKKGEELFKYEDLIDMEQTLFIGGQPHEYKPDKFDKNSIHSVYSIINFSWDLKFKSIFFYVNDTIKKSLTNYNFFRVRFNDFFIHAPFHYFKNIKEAFFDKYLSLNICHIISDDYKYSFYCDKSEKFGINNLKEFPTLYLEHFELNYTFELGYKDLFLEKNNMYIFLIVNFEEIYDWLLGRIFFIKYLFYFNHDKNTINFYHPKEKGKNETESSSQKEQEEENNNNNNNYLMLIVFLACLLVICAVIIGFLVYKYYKNKRKKKRANELNDDFDYIADSIVN
jgi:hypothetical protein